MRQVVLRQRSLAATQHLDTQLVAMDRQQRRQAPGRRRDAVERPGIRGQSGEPVPVRGQAPLAAVRFAQEQLPAAGLDATEQQPSLSQRQVAASAQLPGRASVVGIGEAAGQRYLGAGTPPAVAVAQPVKAAGGIEAWLLDRLAASGSGQAARTPILRQAQAGLGPGLVRTVPFDPGQPPPLAGGTRRGVEIGALDQHPARAIGVQAHDAMHDPGRPMALFHRQQGIPGIDVGQVAVATLRPAAQHLGCAARSPAAYLLVGFVDPGQPVERHAAGAAAVLVDPAAHRAVRRGGLLQHAVAPQVQARARAGRIEFHPGQPAMGRLQLAEIAPGGYRALGAPVARPVAVVDHCLRPCRSGVTRAGCARSARPGQAAPPRPGDGPRGSGRAVPTWRRPGRWRRHRR